MHRTLPAGNKPLAQHLPTSSTRRLWLSCGIGGEQSLRTSCSTVEAPQQLQQQWARKKSTAPETLHALSQPTPQTLGLLAQPTPQTL
eukprot:360158-Chlamydomonas_euryale.AAC.7